MQGIVKGGLNDGGGSNIKSIQRGTATLSSGVTSLDVLIGSVDLTKSVVKIQLYTTNTATINTFFVKAKLTTATNINLSRYTGTSDGLTVYWEVIEFNNVKSLQKGDTTTSGTTVTNITIASVDINKSIVFESFNSNNTGAINSFYVSAPSTLANGITIATIGFAGNLYRHWQVIEFN